MAVVTLHTLFVMHDTMMEDGLELASHSATEFDHFNLFWACALYLACESAGLFTLGTGKTSPTNTADHDSSKDDQI
jgi:hypothetical protein